MASQQDTVMSNTAIQRQDSDEHPASRQQDSFQETAGAEKGSDNFSKVKSWNVKDVIHWLENKHLHKFIPLFQEFHVTGQDLIDLNLPFLSNYDHVSVDERELLLSKIYNLFHPGTVHASEEDLTKITSPVDKTKYYAAIQLAQVKGDVPRAHSVFVLPSHSSMAKSASLTRGLPVIKARHKSESAVQRSTKMARGDAQDFTKRRKTVPKLTKRTNLYDNIERYGSRGIRCVALTAEQRDQLGLSIDGDNHIVISDVPKTLTNNLHQRDRVLEINGHIIPQQTSKDVQPDFAGLLHQQTPVKLVVLTENAVLETVKNASFEEKWSHLHSMLVEMRDAEEPELSPTSPLSASFDPTTYFQEEIEKLKAAVKEQEKQTDELQQELEDKDAMMHDLQLSRDKAIEKLQQTRSALGNKNSRENVGGTEYFNLTMNSLELEDKSKEEVVESLKEIVMEASKQKWYLDRLISLVIEESPWLLDDVDAEFDNLTLSDKSEEFC